MRFAAKIPVVQSKRLIVGPSSWGKSESSLATALMLTPSVDGELTENRFKDVNVDIEQD